MPKSVVLSKGKRAVFVCLGNYVQSLHLIVSTASETTISDFVRDFKKYTSKKIIEEITNNNKESRRDWMLSIFQYAGKGNRNNKDYQFWQQDYHPVELNSKEKLIQRLNYLHENSVRAGIVWQAQDYKYSSAIDYYENKEGAFTAHQARSYMKSGCNGEAPHERK